MEHEHGAFKIYLLLTDLSTLERGAKP